MSQPPLSLYIHVPFCTKRCPYCAFFKDTNYSQEQAYVEALCTELRLVSQKIEARPIGSIFFGGGTPNSLGLQSLKALFDTLKTQFVWDPNLELTMEMNPESVSEDKLAFLVDQGLNRISLGVQSFNATQLETLGRWHTLSHIERALALMAKHRVENFNLDLMFSLPGGTPDLLATDLAKVIAVGATHVSVYALTIEKGTEFYKTGVSPLPESQELADYQQVIDTLAVAGFDHYEVSAFAKPGYRCWHNESYWRFRDYIGVGPSASSYYQGRYFKNKNDLAGYINQPTTVIEQALAGPALPLQTQQHDAIVSGLRLRDGIALAAFEQRFGMPLPSLISTHMQALIQEGWVGLSPTHFWVTKKGLPLLDSILEQLLVP